MKKALLILASIIAMIFILIFIYLRYIRVPDHIMKTAVTQSSLIGKNYVICRRARVTGFDWLVITDNNGMKYEYCNIIGANPFSELNLSDDFVFSDNRYVFYIIEKRVYYSEELHEDCLEFVVSGWDILYPVNHGILNLLNSPKYITLADTRLMEE
jgi:hypothetical protein